MCDPVSLGVGSALAGAAGSYMNAQNGVANQKAAINAGNQANIDLAAKEDALRAQARPVFDTALKPYQDGAPAQNLSTAQAGNTNFFQNNAPTAAQLSNGVIGTNAPQVVSDSANQTLASRMQKMATADHALGNLTGYDTVNQNNVRANHSAADDLGVISDFARENATVGAATRNAAIVNSQKLASPFADILQGAGQIGSYGAGKGWFSRSPTTGLFG